MKICSLLPSATEIACALGLQDDLVAVTHECDYPAAVLGKPRITSSAIDHTGSTSAEIHRHISAAVHRGSSIYHWTGSSWSGCLRTWSSPRSSATSVQSPTSRSNGPCESPGVTRPSSLLSQRRWRKSLRRSFASASSPDATHRLRASSPGCGSASTALRPSSPPVESRPRVLCMEWLDPVFVGGHWVPGMVEAAGGFDGLGRPGQPSFVVTWRQVEEYAPEVVVLMPCGYHLQEVVDEFRRTPLPAEWHRLPAMQAGRVYAVDASSYFNRPGPRIVDGLEVLAQVLHPDLAPAIHGPDDYRRIDA